MNTIHKKRPVIVVREGNNTVTDDGNEEEMDLDKLIEERDNLYRKAMDTKGVHMQVKDFNCETLLFTFFLFC